MSATRANAFVSNSASIESVPKPTHETVPPDGTLTFEARAALIGSGLSRGRSEFQSRIRFDHRRTLSCRRGVISRRVSRYRTAVRRNSARPCCVPRFSTVPSSATKNRSILPQTSVTMIVGGSYFTTLKLTASSSFAYKATRFLICYLGDHVQTTLRVTLVILAFVIPSHPDDPPRAK